MNITGETLGTDRQEFTEGRGGLKIPVFERGEHELEWRADVQAFFIKFWELNERLLINPGSDRRLIIPPEDGKPLTIIESVTGGSERYGSDHSSISVPRAVVSEDYSEVVGYHEFGSYTWPADVSYSVNYHDQVLEDGSAIESAMAEVVDLLS